MQTNPANGMRKNGLHGSSNKKTRPRRMKHDEIEHFRYFGQFLRDNWELFAGGATALWYAMIRIKRAILRDYATTQQVNETRDEICRKIDEADRRNTEQHDHIMETIIKHLDKR